MNKQIKRIFGLLLAVAILLTLGCTAFAEESGSDLDTGGGITETGEEEEPVVQPIASDPIIITFVDDDTYELTARPGTFKNKNGDVQVNIGDAPSIVRYIYVPDIDLDKNLGIQGWAIKNAKGELVPIDIATYVFTHDTDVYPVLITGLGLIKDDHFGYVQGFPDGTFKPDGDLTRAQVATMFYRLLVDKTMYGAEKNFTDVAKTHWAYTAIQVLADRGVLQGYPDGTFAPEDSITRAEFCAIASRFFTVRQAPVPYGDLSSTYWAYKNVGICYANGWLDDTVLFRPLDNITRAETVVIINRMLERQADKTFITYNLNNVYSDVSVNGTPTYFDIMEASIAHDFTVTGGTESWTKIR